ncbi:MAG: hypothetical protein ACOY4R_31445 [Pseudomonadota bacterium]
MAQGGSHLRQVADSEAATRLAREQKYERARAALADTGWLFDDFVNVEMRRILTSDPDDMTTRELAYNRARVATELKASLAALVEEHEAQARRTARRDGLMETFHGR